MQHESDIEAALNKLGEYSAASDEEAQSLEATLLDRIRSGMHVILSGPPGTGKTRLVHRLLEKLDREGELGESCSIQFHREFSYQEFMDGFQPTGQGFEPKPGVFRKFVDSVRQSNGNNLLHLFTIDEINRADVSSVFGELLTLLEDSEKKEVKLSRSGEVFQIPRNVVILGTMNTADRTIALMDFALRRRFSILFVAPDYQAMMEWICQKGWDVEEFSSAEYIQALRCLNLRICEHPLLGKGMMLGPALFVPPGDDPITLTRLLAAFNEKVLPQMESYLGQGQEHELEMFVGGDIKNSLKLGVNVAVSDFVGLIKVLANAQS